MIDGRLLLASPLGFLVGVSLGALGGGGSILAVPVLVFVAGQSPSAATTTALVVVGFAAAVGAFAHRRSGRVRIGTGLAFGFVGAGGSVAGSMLNRRLDGRMLLLLFAALILVAAWRIATGCPGCTKAGEDAVADGQSGAAGPPAARSPAAVVKVVLVGTAVGFLTGLFGVGGGFLIVPALAIVLAMPMPEAVGTSLLVIALNAAVALASRLGSGAIEWTPTVFFSAAAAVGVGAGKRLADRLDAVTMQRAFAGLLVVVALYTGARAAFSLM